MSPPIPPDPGPPAAGPDWTGRIIGGRYRVESVLHSCYPEWRRRPPAFAGSFPRFC